ncbi:MAG: phosphatidylserine decarboxylase family protein [Gemmatimonadales bacterium]|nr:phosphatidylserine decarboxylase family protein [Gemmatimonadales bacterium]
MKIAPEGWPFVFGAWVVWAGAASVGVALGAWWWLYFGVWAPVALWVPWFFRNPTREGPRGGRLVIAPADGKVVGVREVDEPGFPGRRATRVSIFMNIFSVHVNRHPADGIVSARDYRAGRFLNATLDKASEHNERMSLVIDTEHGPMLVRQIAGLVARRIVTDPAVGDAVRQGERLGLIRFGSRVDTLLRPGARVLVEVGDRTRAGITPIAEWES